MQQYRVMTLERRNDTERAVEASLSSETPVYRSGMGNEILLHDHGSIDLSRCPLPLLTSHDSAETPIGIVENVRIVAGKLRGVLRFGGSSRALDVWEDVKAGVLRSISIGYQILDGNQVGDDYHVTRWMPFEASLVSVPADPTVGIGRSFQGVSKMEITNNAASEDRLSRSQRRAAARDTGEVTNSMLEINALSRQFNVSGDDVRDFVERRGADVDAFRQFVLSKMNDTGTLRVSEDSEIGLSSREAERFSFRKAILAQIDPKYARQAGFEAEVSRAVAQKLGREPQGVFVPQELLSSRTMQRDMAVGTPSAGGYLRPVEHLANSFIDVLRNASHVMALGATDLKDLRGDVSIPRKEGSTTAYWVAEGDAPPDSDMTFGQVPLSPKTVAGWTAYSRKLMLQGSPDIEMLVRSDLASTLAVELDRAAINGSGVGAEPLGILNIVGVGGVAIGADGGAPTWEHVLDLEQALALANADAGTLAYLGSTKIRRKLKGALKVSGDAAAGFIWQDGAVAGEGRVNGYRAMASNNVPSNLTKGSGTGLSAMVFGNWSDLFVGQWGALDILVDPYTLSTSGGVRVTALLDVDVAVRRVQSFAVIKDAVTQ